MYPAGGNLTNPNWILSAALGFLGLMGFAAVSDGNPKAAAAGALGGAAVGLALTAAVLRTEEYRTRLSSWGIEVNKATSPDDRETAYKLRFHTYKYKSRRR